MDFELSCVCHSCSKQSTVYLILQPVVLGNNGCCLCFDKFLPIWKLMFILFFPFLGLANPIQQIFLNRPYLLLSSVHQVICFPPKGRAKKWIITPDLRGGLTNTSEIANPTNIFQNNVCFFFFETASHCWHTRFAALHNCPFIHCIIAANQLFLILCFASDFFFICFWIYWTMSYWYQTISSINQGHFKFQPAPPMF